jgi:hypothetical protein
MSTTPQVVQIVGGTYQDDLHLYRDAKGIERPSVTQIMDGVGLVDYSNVPGDTLEHKRQIGDVTHYATRLYDQNDLDPFSVHEEAAPYLECYMNMVDEVGLEPDPEWIEKGFIHVVNGMTYAGTIDRVCRFTKGTSWVGKLILLELKCAYAEEASWKWQMSGYEIPVKAAFPKESIIRVACQLRPGKQAKLFPYLNPRDKDVFLWALALTNAKINEGIKWKRERL